MTNLLVLLSAVAAVASAQNVPGNLCDKGQCVWAVQCAVKQNDTDQYPIITKYSTCGYKQAQQNHERCALGDYSSLGSTVQNADEYLKGPPAIVWGNIHTVSHGGPSASKNKEMLNDLNIEMRGCYGSIFNTLFNEVSPLNQELVMRLGDAQNVDPNGNIALTSHLSDDNPQLMSPAPPSKYVCKFNDFYYNQTVNGNWFNQHVVLTACYCNSPMCNAVARNQAVEASYQPLMCNSYCSGIPMKYRHLNSTKDMNVFSYPCQQYEGYVGYDDINKMSRNQVCKRNVTQCASSKLMVKNGYMINNNMVNYNTPFYLSGCYDEEYKTIASAFGVDVSNWQSGSNMQVSSSNGAVSGQYSLCSSANCADIYDKKADFTAPPQPYESFMKDSTTSMPPSTPPHTSASSSLIASMSVFLSVISYLISA